MHRAGGLASKLVWASQAPDHRLVLRMLANEVRSLRQFKISKIEPRGYGAADERPRLPIGHVRGEPVPGGDDGLKNLAGIRIVSQQKRRIATCRIDDVH